MRLKFNNGNGAVLCDRCSTIIYTGGELHNLGVKFDKKDILKNKDLLSKISMVNGECLCNKCNSK